MVKNLIQFFEVIDNLSGKRFFIEFDKSAETITNKNGDGIDIQSIRIFKDEKNNFKIKGNYSIERITNLQQLNKKIGNYNKSNPQESGFSACSYFTGC